MYRLDCGACGAPDPVVFLDLGKTPLANTFPATADAAETYYPLQLGRCGSCGMVQQMEVVPDAEIYGPEYGFFSGGSAAQRAYHAAGARLLLNRWPRLIDERGVVEIACNDGSLLAHFAEAGVTCLGIDPAGPAQVAVDAGLPVMREPFTAALGARLRDERGPAGLVIAYNSLAHVEDLSDVLTGIWALMDDESIAVVEVQYLPDLLAGNLIGQVYHEHRFFASLSAYARAAKLHQLRIIDAELIELQGGGIRITLSRDPAARPSNRVGAIYAQERWLGAKATFDGMQGRVDRNRDHLIDILSDQAREGRAIAGYAAAAKATTILNYAQLTAGTIREVADTTPYKQGRYIPGVKIPIVPPEGIGWADTRLLLTANYLPHLLRSDREFLDRGGRWIIAEPIPMVV